MPAWKMCLGMAFVSVGCRPEYESYLGADDARIEGCCWGWAPLPPWRAGGMMQSETSLEAKVSSWMRESNEMREAQLEGWPKEKEM